MIAIRCDIAVGLIDYLLGTLVCHIIPNGLALVVRIPAALNLIRGRADAPQKIIRKMTRIARWTAKGAVELKQDQGKIYINIKFSI